MYLISAECCHYPEKLCFGKRARSECETKLGTGYAELTSWFQGRTTY